MLKLHVLQTRLAVEASDEVGDDVIIARSSEELLTKTVEFYGLLGEEFWPEGAAPDPTWAQVLELLEELGYDHERTIKEV